MSRVIALVVLALTATACKDEKLERLAAIRDDVCACKSSSCARAMLAVAQREATPSNPRTQKLGRDMLDCLADLLEVEAEAMAGSDAPPEDVGSGSEVGTGGIGSGGIGSGGMGSSGGAGSSGPNRLRKGGSGSN